MLLALFFRRIAPTENLTAAAPTLCLVERRAGAMFKVAAAPISVEAAYCPTEADSADPRPAPPGFALDSAPYEVAPESTAFGVRLNCTYSLGGGNGESEHFFLFERQGVRLAQVWDEDIGSLSYDRVARTRTTRTGSVIVQHELRDGHFDLAIHISTTVQPDQGQASTKGETRRFVWQADRYVPERR